MMRNQAEGLLLPHWRALLKQIQALGVSQIKKGLTVVLLVPEAAGVERSPLSEPFEV